MCVPNIHEPAWALPAEWERWLPHLGLLDLPLGHVVYEPGAEQSHVYFPTSSIVSLLYVMENGASAEIAVCRWLLLSLDRLRGSELVMTQELIANLLGVRREGVTEGALKLQAAGCIRSSCGRITVLDRPALEQRSRECYSVVKKEYDRLLPDRLAS